MKKRGIILMMAGIMTAALLTGCGEKSSNMQTAAEGKEKAETTKEEAGASDRVTLVVPKVGYNQEQIDTANAKDGGPTYEDKYYMTVTESIKKSYPDYDMQYVDWGWGETLDEKQRALFAAGSAPDIVAGETFMPTYANEGLLEPLPQDIIDSVDPTFLLYDKEGKAVAVSYKTSIFMLFYNKDLLKAAGLDPETPPTTWDEWKTMSDQVTAAGNGEFWGGGIPSFPHAGGALRATPFFRMNGTDFAVDGVINLQDPKLQEVLQYIRDMNYNFPAGLGNGSDENPLWDAFNKDKTIAFVVQGSWQGSDASRDGVNWGVAPLPTRDGTQGNCTVGSVYLAVPKDAKHKDESFNIIRETLKLDNEKVWLEGSYCPAIKQIIDDPSYYKDDVALEIEMSVIKNGTYTGVAVFPKNDSAIWEVINQKVLARTTMTEDPIAAICNDALSEIEPLQK